MCDEVCSRGTCCLRCGLFGSILLMITGVGLTIAGVVVFGATNPRVALVDEYNKLGNAYQNKDFGPFASMTFSVNASGTVKSAAQAVSLVDVIGSIDGVTDFSSRIFVVTGIPRGELSRATVIARGSTSAFSPLIFSAAPLSTVHTSKLYCESKECNGKDKCTCSTAMMQEKCTSLYNGSYTSTGYGKDCRTDRSEDDACGQCRYTVYLTGVCVPMTFDPSAITVVPSLKYSSCEYPFGSADGQYASTNPDTPVSVKFMADTDPLIQLQRLTKGSRNLGWSSKDQNTVGAGLLVPGILAILAAVGCIVWIRRSHEEDMQEARARAENGGFEMQARGAVGDNNGESHHPTAHAIQVGQPIHQAPPPGVIDYSHPTTPAMGPGPQQQQQQQQPGGYYGQPQYGYAAAAPPVKTAA